MSTVDFDAVNRWRGQCMDKFARAERAIVLTIEALQDSRADSSLRLHETAANRTRDLSAFLRKHRANDPSSKRAAALLDRWGLREKQRNDYVHGCFTIKSSSDAGWSFVNEARDIKKGVAFVRREFKTEGEASAFYLAIASETKALEEILAGVRIVKL